MSALDIIRANMRPMLSSEENELINVVEKYAMEQTAQLQQERDNYKQEVNKVNLKLIEVSIERVKAVELLKAVDSILNESFLRIHPGSPLAKIIREYISQQS